jgi:dephospho-CoA kinase
MKWKSFAPAHGTMEALVARIKGDDNRLVLGVTGGIASGKSTVCAMLESLGMPLIDMDRLARDVVAKGTPGLAAVVAAFGRDVLDAQGGLDRQRLSKIVFADPRLRKKLEGIIHPAIIEHFVTRVNRIAAVEPGALIQVAVPLLIELKMEAMFHKVLVVHIPPEEQIKRLIRRDRIGRSQAENILAAQMPIDDKPGHADYVVYNHNSREETRAQVEEIWKALMDSIKFGSVTTGRLPGA